jgi:TolB-like protein/Tfp pilus assembly protein PilF
LNDYSDKGTEDFFSDGMTEEMITQLGSLDPCRLGVIARTSVGRYKNTEKSIDEIGRELDVDYVVEGSVRRAGGRVRISVQLIQVWDQTHVWAESYERDYRDVLMLQDEVGQSIARQIRITLTPQQEARFTRRRHVDPEAYEAYLRGRYHWCKLSGDGWKQGRERFEQAIARDPDYAPAHAGLADCFIKFGQFGFMPPEEAFACAREAARKAVALDDLLAEAHGSLAMIWWIYDWEWTAAEQEFRRSIALGPHIAIIRGWHALYLLSMGRMEECFLEIQAGLALEPLGNLANCLLGFYHYVNREHDIAVVQLRRCVELHPDSLPAHFLFGQALLARADYDNAIASFRKAAQLSGTDVASGFLGLAFVLSGRHQEAAQLLYDLREKAQRTYVAATTFASLSLARGDLDQMYAWFDKACEERDSNLVMIRCLPDFDSLRLDPRFKSLVERVRFPS